jgi:uncharacterized protein (DUF433 family)
VPQATLRAWSFGQRGDRGRIRFKPVIDVRDPADRLLSFKNLVAAHVLSALRVQHQIPLQRLRKILDALSRQTHSRDPLFELPLLTDGAEIFVQTYEGMVNASHPGQMALAPILEAYLQRLDFDSKSGVARLFPFIRRQESQTPEALLREPKVVVIDPRISFGKPILVGTNIRTSIIAERYMAGESVTALAEDYHRPPLEIEEAIRCESAAA